MFRGLKGVRRSFGKEFIPHMTFFLLKLHSDAQPKLQVKRPEDAMKIVLTVLRTCPTSSPAQNVARVAPRSSLYRALTLDSLGTDKRSYVCIYKTGTSGLVLVVF